MGNILTSINNPGLEIPANEQGAGVLYTTGYKQILLKKTLHNILFNKTDIIQGKKVYTNQLKAYCGTNRSDLDATQIGGGNPGDLTGIKTNFGFNGRNIVNVSLPNVVNTMILSTIPKQTLYTTISKMDITVNISEDNNVINEDMKTLAAKGTEMCGIYIGDMCAKQLYKNDCFTLINNTWVWNYNNSRCVIDNFDFTNEDRTQIQFNDIKDNTTPALYYDYTKIIVDTTQDHYKYIFQFIDLDPIKLIETSSFWEKENNIKYITTMFGLIPYKLDELKGITQGGFKVGGNFITKLEQIKNALYINYLYKYEFIFKKSNNLKKKI